MSHEEHKKDDVKRLTNLVVQLLLPDGFGFPAPKGAVVGFITLSTARREGNKVEIWPTMQERQLRKSVVG